MSFFKNTNFPFSKSAIENTTTALSDFQRKNMQGYGAKMQLDHLSYLHEHPEISAIITTLLSRFIQRRPTNNDMLKEVALYFVSKSEADFYEEFGNICKLSSATCTQVTDSFDFWSKKKYEDVSPRADLVKDLIEGYMASTENITSENVSSNATTSSFMSIKTSKSTLQTPEYVPTPEPTLTEAILEMILKIVNKAVYSQVTEWMMLYDIAYVELMKAVEVAMEMPVIEIRKDIFDILNIAYRIFELKIEENKRLADEATWENRIKKKLKRTLRRQRNYKGYETPQVRELGAQESCTKAPEVQYSYNRYPKDPFGVYLPRDTEFSNESITAPAGIDDVFDHDMDAISMKSVAISMKSAAVKYSFASLALASTVVTKINGPSKSPTHKNKAGDTISEDLKHPTHVLFKPE